VGKTATKIAVTSIKLLLPSFKRFSNFILKFSKERDYYHSRTLIKVSMATKDIILFEKIRNFREISNNFTLLQPLNKILPYYRTVNRQSSRVPSQLAVTNLNFTREYLKLPPMLTIPKRNVNWRTDQSLDTVNFSENPYRDFP
jgi:hypothetical protein